MRFLRRLLPFAGAIVAAFACDSTRPDFCTDASVAIAPTVVTLLPGATTDLAAEVRSAGTVAQCAVRWSAISESGTMDGSGRFTASARAGDYPDAILATAGRATASARVIILPAAPARLTIVPETVTVLPGDRARITLIAFDAWGNTVPVEATWSVAPSAGAISPDGTLTAGTVAGVFADSLHVSAQGLVARASVHVLRGETRVIHVMPDAVRLAAGDSVQLAATAEDAWGNATPVTPKWQVSGSGSISPSGVYHATRAGIHQVLATAGLRGSTSVTVTAGAVTSIAIRPDTLVTLPLDSVQATVQAADAWGNPVEVTPEWSLAPEAGTLVGQGYVKAGTTAGTYAGALSATVGTLTAQADVRINPDKLAAVVVTPARATVVAGDSVLLNATPVDRFGNAIARPVTWSLYGVGTMNSSGWYAGRRSGTAVAYAWVERAGEEIGSATITTIPGPAVKLIVEPPYRGWGCSCCNQLGCEPIHFFASGEDAYGNSYLELTPAPVWTVDEGMGAMSSDGVYRPIKSCRATDIIRATSGLLTGTAIVGISDPTMYAIQIVPWLDTMYVGETKRIVTRRDYCDHSEFGGGNLYFEGTYLENDLLTAPMTPGIYSLEAYYDRKFSYAHVVVLRRP